MSHEGMKLRHRLRIRFITAFAIFLESIHFIYVLVIEGFLYIN